MKRVVFTKGVPLFMRCHRCELTLVPRIVLGKEPLRIREALRKSEGSSV